MLAESSTTSTTSGRSVRCRWTVQPYSISSTMPTSANRMPASSTSTRRAALGLSRQVHGQQDGRRQPVAPRAPATAARSTSAGTTFPGRPVRRKALAHQPAVRLVARSRSSAPPAEMPGETRIAQQEQQHAQQQQPEVRCSVLPGRIVVRSLGRVQILAELAGQQLRIEAGPRSLSRRIHVDGELLADAAGAASRRRAPLVVASAKLHAIPAPLAPAGVCSLSRRARASDSGYRGWHCRAPAGQVVADLQIAPFVCAGDGQLQHFLHQRRKAGPGRNGRPGSRRIRAGRANRATQRWPAKCFGPGRSALRQSPRRRHRSRAPPSRSGKGFRRMYFQIGVVERPRVLVPAKRRDDRMPIVERVEVILSFGRRFAQSGGQNPLLAARHRPVAGCSFRAAPGRRGTKIRPPPRSQIIAAARRPRRG